MSVYIKYFVIFVINFKFLICLFIVLSNFIYLFKIYKNFDRVLFKDIIYWVI